MEDVKFLDTLVYIHVHMVIMHKHKTVMMVLIIESVWEITVLPM